MCILKPSATFIAFVARANTFEIRRHPVGGAHRFEAKQQMIARAEGFAIREAYSVPWWKLFVPGILSEFFKGLHECDERLAKAQSDPTFQSDPESNDEWHRPEIRLNLYARTIQQITLRRLYTAAVAASVGAVVVSAIAVWCSRR